MYYTEKLGLRCEDGYLTWRKQFKKAVKKVDIHINRVKKEKLG